ncbi:ead/Ea22-like family protein [Citrobacter portucalensis]|uniref:ead/Ea22-like family protein n=1 Tax=Citrobacter portucalensis TaxID=1639133 RepID=UPI003219BAA4
MTALNKQALREAAEKATPGRWEYYPGNTSIEYNVDSMDEDQGSIVYVDSGDFTQKQTDLNGAFIASANPSTVLALLDELEAAEKRIAEQNFENRLLANADRDIKALRQRIAGLEARTPYGYLRQCDGQIQISIGSERPHDRSGGYATPWFAIYTAAGIGVKGSEIWLT